MLPRNPQLEEMERASHRIVSMICSEAVAEDDVQSAIEALRRRAAEAFPGDPRLFERVYGRRFARLRTRFRPAPGLFPVAG